MKKLVGCDNRRLGEFGGRGIGDLSMARSFHDSVCETLDILDRIPGHDGSDGSD